MEPLGFVALPEIGPIWLQRDRHVESVVLSTVSLVGAAFWSSHWGLSCWRIYCFWYCLHSRGHSSAKIGHRGLSPGHRATGDMVLFDFSDGVFSSHRLSGESVSCPRFGFAAGSAHAAVVAGWRARGAGLDDTRNWRRLGSCARCGSHASILGRATLEMALALDRVCARRLRCLF